MGYFPKQRKAVPWSSDLGRLDPYKNSLTVLPCLNLQQWGMPRKQAQVENKLIFLMQSRIQISWFKTTDFEEQRLLQ